MVLLRDMNRGIENSEVVGIGGKWGVDRVYKNGEHLMDISAKRSLVLANTIFQHRLINR